MIRKCAVLAVLAAATMFAGTARGDEGKLVFATHPIQSEKDPGTAARRAR